MKKIKICIRVDGNTKIGLGHLVRCIALALMLKNNFDIVFVCIDIPLSIENEIKGHGFNLIIIDSEVDFLSLLKNDVVVVLDHYGLDSSCQKIIKNKGCKLICIDDLHDKEFFADLIINPAPHVVAADYHAQTYSQFALGLDYALLRPAFLNKAKDPVGLYTETQVVFVCFGGADIKNITQRVVNILKNDVRVKKTIIITGAAYIYLNELKQSIEHDARFFLHHSIDSETMVNLIEESQLAIVPSSGILQEVLAVGCKIVSGIYVENQKYIFESYKALGAFESAGDFSDRNLLYAIDRSFANKNTIKKYIDGRSGDRLSNTFVQLIKEDSVLLSKINENDLIKTFEWAGNSEIRKFSFNNKPIKYNVHKTWFMNRLNDENCFYYLGKIDNNPFGSIRFEVEQHEAKISYLIDPVYQNNGLGTILLKKGLNLFMEQFQGYVTTVWGDVFHMNFASLKVFRKLGYTEELDLLTGIIKFKKLI